MSPREQVIEEHVKKPRWAIVATALCIVLAIITAASVAGFFYSKSGSDTSHDVQESSRRADCRSAYNADLQSVIRARDDIKLSLDAQYYRATFNQAVYGIAPTNDATALFGVTLNELDKARDKVNTLPKLDDAVDNGFKLDGVTRPPCPG